MSAATQPGQAISRGLQQIARLDNVPAVLSLVLMMVLPLIEMALRPVMGRGIDNAPVLVQHLGLVLAMFGAIAAARRGHLSSLGSNLDQVGSATVQAAVRAYAKGAPVRVIGASTTGTANYWYVQANSPIKTAKDPPRSASVAGWRNSTSPVAFRPVRLSPASH